MTLVVGLTVAVWKSLAPPHPIFSTPPAEVITKNALENIGRDAMLVDLASPPFGFDLNAAQVLGLNAWREQGLPGRYCPVSAARAVYHAILRWEEKQHG